MAQDFGETWAGAIVTRPFVFKNIGTETLKILEARPHCSCSVAEDYTREVPPGKTGTIPFKLDTTRKTGEVDESITIKTNDPTNPNMVLRLTGRVKIICATEVIQDDSARSGSFNLVKIRGDAGFFGRITENQRLNRVLRLVNATGAPLSLDLVSIVPESARFVARLNETKPKQEYELSIRGMPPFAVGANNCSVIFRTNIPEQPTYQVDIYAYVPPRIEVIPMRIIIDKDTPPLAKRVIRINNHGDAPLEISGLAATDPSFQLSVVTPSAQDTGPKSRGVQLILPPDYRPPAYGEIIRISTTNKDMPRIDIPILPDAVKTPAPRPSDKPLEFFPAKRSASAP